VGEEEGVEEDALIKTMNLQNRVTAISIKLVKVEVNLDWLK